MNGISISVWMSKEIQLAWPEIKEGLERQKEIPLGPRAAVGLWRHQLSDLDGAQYLFALSDQSPE